MMEVNKYSAENVTYGITRRNGGVDFGRRENKDVANGKVSSVDSSAWDALKARLGFSSVLHRRQVHGVEIERIVKHSNPSNGVADALFTTEKNILLAVTVADCCGVVLWDTSQTVVGCIHSGWRGTHANIVGLAIESIHLQTGVTPHGLHAWLSPCASGRAYHVRKDVQQLFPAYCTRVDGSVNDASENVSFLFDNGAAIRDQLMLAGLSRDNISGPDECTILSTDYHSFRRDGEQSGRNAVFVGMH